MKKCIILAAGPEEDLEYVKALKKEKPDAVFICADGGLLHAERLGLRPSVVVGDFDSGKLPGYPDVEVIRLNPEKDDSDLMSCVKIALQRDYTEIDIAGATGGRLDHLLSNLSLLEYVYERGGVCTLRNAQNYVQFHEGGLKKYRRDAQFKYVSFIPLDRVLTGVTLTGLYYPLKDAVLSRSAVLSISNEPVAEEFTIYIETGRALVLFTKD